MKQFCNILSFLVDENKFAPIALLHIKLYLSHMEFYKTEKTPALIP